MTHLKTLEQDVRHVCDLANSKAQRARRTIIGVAGPPASGKSTLAEAVVLARNSEAAGPVPEASLLPMDGYHLDNRVLESRGTLARKGSPETINASDFCSDVRGLVTARHSTYHPKFDRQMDLAIANSIVIHPDTPVVVVEGNYLLLQSAPWKTLQNVFTATVFVCPSMQSLKDRLVQRWIKHGFDPEAALLKATANDLPNAEKVIRDSAKADLNLTQDYNEFGLRYAF